MIINLKNGVEVVEDGNVCHVFSKDGIVIKFDKDGTVNFIRGEKKCFYSKENAEKQNQIEMLSESLEELRI